METPEKPIAHITKVEIQKLWGLDDWNLSWELNPDVNILAGDNGSGKSTVLKTIFYMLVADVHNQYLKNIKINSGGKAVVNFTNDKTVHLLSIQFSKNVVEKYKQNSLSFIDDVEKTHGISNLQDRVWDWKENEATIKYPLYIGEVNLFYISTFDQKLKPLEAIQKLAGTGVETDLDWELYQLQDKYKDYRIHIGERAIEALQKGSQDIESINGKLSLFWNMVDELFGKTEKQIERDKTNLSFLLRQGKVLTAYELSAGEKQMLIILLTALVQDNQPAIMMMDEPEISLHTDWQENLIDYIRKLNENVQLIIATHSPFLLTNGWANKKYVFQIENLKAKII